MLLPGHDSEESIPIPNMNEAVMKKVLEWCSHHRNEAVMKKVLEWCEHHRNEAVMKKVLEWCSHHRNEAVMKKTTLGLIKNLKVPSPTSTPPPTDKEVLFLDKLINLVTSEMWNNGFVKESERFLANVMQSIQQEVDES
ncbi:Myosin MYO2 [Pyrenophora teres f. maculata]|nr:Myosin MYO2 [Pyrenophora teres f. maculata]